MNFTFVHLRMSGGSNKENIDEENSITRRRESGFEPSLMQEAVMKIYFENKVEGKKITRWKEKNIKYMGILEKRKTIS